MISDAILLERAICKAMRHPDHTHATPDAFREAAAREYGRPITVEEFDFAIARLKIQGFVTQR